MSNGRKVSTDALETLGTIIDDSQKRDAIHIAVLPIVAAERLLPAQHIGLAAYGVESADFADDYFNTEDGCWPAAQVTHWMPRFVQPAPGRPKEAP